MGKKAYIELLIKMEKHIDKYGDLIRTEIGVVIFTPHGIRTHTTGSEDRYSIQLS